MGPRRQAYLAACIGRFDLGLGRFPNVTTPAIRPDTRDVMAPVVGGDRESGVFRWALLVAAVTLCVSIGLPLVGVRVFFPSDVVLRFDPWRNEEPPGYRIANPVLADPVDGIMPMRAEFRRRVWAGEYPMWASGALGGGPLGTVPNWSVLSPLELPYLVLPLWYAPAVAKLLEMVAAVSFTYLFARRLSLGKVPALVGGLVYAFSGFQVVWTYWPQSHMGALIPGLFWATERGIQRGNARSWLPLSVVVAIMMLEGFPIVLLYAGIAAGLYLLVRVITARGWDTSMRLKGVARFGGAVSLGLLISALQVLPFLDQLRSLDLGYRGQTSGSHLPLRALVTLIIPNAFGSPVDGTFFGRLHYSPPGFVRTGYLEQQGFIGAAAIVLVLVAAIKLWPGSGANPLPRGIRTYLWVGSGVVILLMYIGGPPLALLQKIPPFGTNYIGRLRPMMGFFLACLAAVGLHSLQQRRAGPLPRAARLFAVGVVALAALAGSVGLWRVLDLAKEAHLRTYVLRQSVLPLTVAGAALVAILLGTRRRWAEVRLASWVLPPLVAVEALAFVLPFWPRVPKWTFYPTTSAHRFLQAHIGRDRVAAQGFVLFPGTTTFYGLRSVTGHAFPQQTWADLLRALDPRAQATLPLVRGKRSLITSPILDRLSARYFVDAPENPIPGRRVAAPATAGTVMLGAGSSVSISAPNSRIRGVTVRVVRAEGWRGFGDLMVEVIGPTGAVRSAGVRHLTSIPRGLLTVPVVESIPLGRSPRMAVRVSYHAPGGRLVLASAGAGRPAASVVVGEDDGLHLVFADGATIYRRLNALPRVRWAPRATVISDPAKRVFALAQGVAPDAVVLSRPGPRGSGRPARVHVVQDGEDQIQVTVDASGAGYLVVADAIQNGWEARVDGRPASLVAADHACVAVLVATGRHEVTLRYDPRGWRPGLVISGISVVLLLGLALWLPRPAAGRPLRAWG